MHDEPIQRVRRLITLSGLAALATACGGGGGSSDAPAPSPAPTSPPAPPAPAPATLALVAGSLQGPGSQDGSAAVARFDTPRGVVQDGTGTTWIADSGNHTIRRIAPDGTVSTFAGLAGVAGSTDGTAAAARFSRPEGLALDAQGHLLVADTGNHTLRRITPAGVVSTLAGAPGEAARVDGPLATARFSTPRSVAVGPGGVVYVAEPAGLRRLVDGTVSTFFLPPGPPLTAVATDAAGNVFVADSPASGFSPGNGTLRKLSAAGAPLAFGTEAVVSLAFPQALAVDAAGNVLVAASGVAAFTPNFSTSSRLVQRVAPDGTVTTLSGFVNQAWTQDGPAVDARFRDPTGIAVGPGGRIIVTEAATSAIRQLDAAGIVTTLAGGSGDGRTDGPAGTARFFAPTDLAFAPDGALLVADSANARLRRIEAGQVTTLALRSASGEAFFLGRSVNALAHDGRGTVYMDLTFSATITGFYAVDLATGVARAFANAGGTNGALAVDAAGRLLVGRQGEVLRYDAAGNAQVLASGFGFVSALAVGPTGTVYAADSGHHVVWAIDAQGAATSLAGQRGASGSLDGGPAESRLARPGALATDPAGNVYVGDESTIRRITPQGEARTIAGIAGRTSGGEPGPALAPLGRVSGLAWQDGALYATLRNAVVRIA